MNISRLAKRAERIITDNSPAIFTAVGVAGVVGTAWLTGKATFKAAEILSDAQFVENVKGDGAPVTTVDKVKKVWKLYLPSLAAGAISCGAIVAANRISVRRAAALAAAYAVSEKRLEDYKDKVKETFSDKQSTKVKDDLAQDRVNKDYDGTLVFSDMEGKVLCHDAYSGRFFYSTREVIDKAVNTINRNLLTEDSATVSDFYDEVGLDHTSLSDEMGWNAAEQLTLTWSTCSTPDGAKPAHSFDFESRPILRPWSTASFR